MKPRNTVSESEQQPTPMQSEARGKLAAKVEDTAERELGATDWDGAVVGGGQPAPGTIIGGRYRVERELGSGGMGVVVAARHLELGHRVAIKLLSLGDLGASKRFLREARICAGLSSEHIVRVFDNGQLPTGTPYMVMEYLQGQDLREFMMGTGVSIADAILIVRQLCAALGEAHAAGIVHRDLKPSNLFRVERSDGSALIKVLDFGISKVADGPIDQAGSKLTQPGGFIGTQHYASPEQLTSSAAVDFRADIWGAGTILYELLTGTLAFPQEHFLACWAAISEARYVPPRQLRPGIPADLEAIVQRCLRVDPGERFASSEELADALDAQLAELEPGSSAFDARSRRRDPQSRGSHAASAARLQSRAQIPLGVSGAAIRDLGSRRRNPFAAVSAAVARSYQALRPRRAPRTSPLRGSMTPIALAAALGLAVSGVVWGKLQDRFAGSPRAPAAAARDTGTVVHAVTAAPEPLPASAVVPEAARAEPVPSARPAKPARRTGGKSTSPTRETQTSVASPALAPPVSDSIDAAPPPVATAGAEDAVDPGAAAIGARSEVPALRPRERAPDPNPIALPATSPPGGAMNTAYSSRPAPQPAAVYEARPAPATAYPGQGMRPRPQVGVIEPPSVVPGVHVHVRTPRAARYSAPPRRRRSLHEALRSLHDDSERPRRHSH
jgi:eukaryotic-like serine/threonine-protein kinase